MSEPSPPQLGDKFRDGQGHLLHVRGFVDEQVVVRYWNKEKQWWVYRCWDVWYFEPKEGFVRRVKT